jgi:hypothetical protein
LYEALEDYMKNGSSENHTIWKNISTLSRT